MNTHANIVAFNRTAKTVFAELYRSFPEPITLRAAELIDEAELDEDFTAQLSRPHNARNNLAATTMRFLSAEGFLRMEDDSSGLTFIGCVLTLKGFTALGRIPKTVEKGQTLGERMLEPSDDALIGALVQTALRAQL